MSIDYSHRLQWAGFGLEIWKEMRCKRDQGSIDTGESIHA